MANFNFNQVILGGRLISDPELKKTPSGVSVASFGIAVNRPHSKDQEQQKADFINCVAWRNTAEFISKYFKKGSSICVVAKLQTRTWTTDNNEKRFAMDVVVQEANFVDSKGDGVTGVQKPTNAQNSAENTENSASAAYTELDNDEDLPF